VIDARIDTLSTISKTQKKIYASIQFVDIAWLVKWASQW
jgi:ribosome-binding ATPase YchF (GTP1/OBG family)